MKKIEKITQNVEQALKKKGGGKLWKNSMTFEDLQEENEEYEEFSGNWKNT